MGFQQVSASGLPVLTDPRVGPSDDHDLVGEVATLQDVQSRGVGVVALGLLLDVLHGEGLPRVEVRGALVDVAVEGTETLVSTDS